MSSNKIENNNENLKSKSIASLNSGHRSRLKKRFLSSPEALPDYELVELLLFLAIPRTDVKPLAKTLLKNFKTLSAIICSEPSEIKKIAGLGDSAVFVFKMVQQIMARILQTDLKQQPLLNSQQKVVDYLKIQMAYLSAEQFRVLFLNKKHFLIIDEIQQSGTIDQVALYCRDIIKRALELGSTSIILVHNHPTGDTSPSKADIDGTMALKDACSHVNVQLLDHIIIGKFGFFSLHEEGII